MQTSAAQGTKPRRGARSGQPTIEAAVAVTAACKRLQKTPIHSTTRRAGGISRLPVVSSHHRSGKFCQTASGARVACSAASAPEPLTSAILSACGSEKVPVREFLHFIARDNTSTHTLVMLVSHASPPMPLLRLQLSLCPPPISGPQSLGAPSLLFCKHDSLTHLLQHVFISQSSCSDMAHTLSWFLFLCPSSLHVLFSPHAHSLLTPAASPLAASPLICI